MADNKHEDILTALQDATREGGHINVQMVRDTKAKIINRPAWAEKKTKAERVEAHRQFLASPLAMEEEYDAVAARFNVPAGYVPRRFLEYGVLAKRDLESEADDAD